MTKAEAEAWVQQLARDNSDEAMLRGSEGIVIAVMYEGGGTATAFAGPAYKVEYVTQAMSRAFGKFRETSVEPLDIPNPNAN